MSKADGSLEERYARQILLTKLGLRGQERLHAATAVRVGETARRSAGSQGAGTSRLSAAEVTSASATAMPHAVQGWLAERWAGRPPAHAISSVATNRACR